MRSGLSRTAGPQYETEAEVDAIDRLGGEVCGFTVPREAKVRFPPHCHT